MVRATAVLDSGMPDQADSGYRAFADTRLRITTSLLVCLIFATNSAIAQGSGVTTQGNTGGLVVPSANILAPGTLALTAGNFAEPQLGAYVSPGNYSLGLGLFPDFELFGRFANYPRTSAASPGTRAMVDLSANLKYRLPPLWHGAPQLAIGLNDLGGGSTFFRSGYVVASDVFGSMGWSIGYAAGAAGDNAAGVKVFDGVFGGLEWAVGASGLSVLAEHDGSRSHAGLRYVLPPLPMLGSARLVATLQHGFGGSAGPLSSGNKTALALSLQLPLGQGTQRAATFRPDKALVAAAPSRLPVRTGAASGVDDSLQALQRALVAVGLERIRVGTRGADLFVEYEDHRYGQTEADAIGLVLGLAAEFAPAQTQRVHATTLKAGQALYETSVDVALYQAFLRDAVDGPVRDSLRVARRPDHTRTDVAWHDNRPSPNTPVRLEIKPEVAYTVATEKGAFDYTLAANIQGLVPLWRGAELYTSYIQRLANSQEFEPGGEFGTARYRNGLKVLALQQSFWLGPHVFANLGVGRYNYDATGAQADATVFVPGRDDVLRLRAGAYERQPGQTRRQALQVSGSYRWAYTSDTWIEAGAQQYSDGTRGPSVVLTRWFGDVAAHLVYRKGGQRQFAGLELSFPLTPRQTMMPGAVQVAGTQQFRRGIRTRITDGNTGANRVQFDAARDLQTDYEVEIRQLNSGRISQAYFAGELQRMREAFYSYARQQLPQ